MFLLIGLLLTDVVQSGVVKININQTYPLKDVSKAHCDLEARKTTGSTGSRSRGVPIWGLSCNEQIVQECFFGLAGVAWADAVWLT